MLLNMHHLKIDTIYILIDIVIGICNVKVTLFR